MLKPPKVKQVQHVRNEVDRQRYLDEGWIQLTKMEQWRQYSFAVMAQPDDKPSDSKDDYTMTYGIGYSSGALVRKAL
jgi:hypothetical protein